MYLLDSNVLINAKNGYYPFSLVPGFWTWVMEEATSSRLFSVPRVRQELKDQEDQLSRWVGELPNGFWLRNTPGYAIRLNELANWVANEPRYTSEAVQTFLASADYHLVAHAADSCFKLVSDERSRQNSQSRVMIPQACAPSGVKAISAISWIQHEATRFEAFTR
jgi:hypothetical protein